jgi:hypothetical protein
VGKQKKGARRASLGNFLRLGDSMHAREKKNMNGKLLGTGRPWRGQAKLSGKTVRSRSKKQRAGEGAS